MGIDVSDNELAALEAIHLFVEILDHYFSNVCELDLVFNFHKVRAVLSNGCMRSSHGWGGRLRAQAMGAIAGATRCCSWYKEVTA